MRFGDDIHAQFDCGFKSPFHSYLEIVGSDGSLVVPTPFKPGRNERIFLTRADKTKTIKVAGQELYIGEVNDMTDAILMNRPPRVSLAESRANTAAILALLESARTGKPIAPSAS
jgi:predicted dehydrogenase